MRKSASVLAFAVGIACTSGYASATELRIGTASTCPETGGPREGESIFGTLAFSVVSAFVGNVATGVVEAAAGYLKDTTNITKTAYSRVDRLLTINPPDAKPADAKDVKLNSSFACIYAVVGEFDDKPNATEKPTPLSTATWRVLTEMGLQGTPRVYFEGLFMEPSKDSAAKGVFYFQPRLFYYADHIKSGGLFGSGKRDLGFTVELLKPGESNALASAVVPIEAIAPDTTKYLGPGYFAKRELPWMPVPGADNQAPVTVKVTLIETGQPNVLDKALGQALIDKKSDIATAIANAVTGKQPPPASGK